MSTTEEPTSTPAHTDHWGDPISAERQAELQGILDAWGAPGTEHGDRRGPLDHAGLSNAERERMGLTGADVSWLADRVRDADGWVRDLHLETLYVNTSCMAPHIIGR